MLKYRILTAIIAIPIIFWIILKLPTLEFAFLMAIVVALAAWEWAHLSEIIEPWFKSLYVALTLLFLLISVHVSVLSLLAIGTFMQLFLLFEILYYQKRGQAFLLTNPFARALLGWLLLIPFWKSALLLKESDQHSLFLLYIVLIVWVVDSGAYFIGKKWGRSKLIEKVSPNKSWEGFFGGVILGLILVIALSFMLPLSNWQPRIWVWSWAILAMLFSVSGDLSISLLKRIAKVKDSGQIFPGHGGMLDRLDSLIAASIIFGLGIYLL